MSQTDKAMELADDYASWCEAKSEGHPATDEAREALRAHIEAMQRDCRTCIHAQFSQDAYDYLKCRLVDCTNHDKYQPMLEFKQLTRSE